MKYAIAVGSILAGVLVSAQSGAVSVYTDKEKGTDIKVAALIQPWMQNSMAAETGSASPGVGAPSQEKTPATEFFLRRARILVYGSITKKLSFFLETDNPNFGKGGDYSTPTYIQDAWLTYEFDPMLKVDFGMMLVPLSHGSLEGATSLNALDYHAEVIRFNSNTKVFRDTGVQLRGMITDFVHYRVGIFSGIHATPAAPAGQPRATLNESGLPRFAGHVRINAVGAEKDFLFKGIYFSETPIVSFGLGFDYQPKAVYNAEGNVEHYGMWSADVFFEVPFTPMDELVGKVNFFGYSNGVPGPLAGTTLSHGGIGGFGEVGFRHDWIEPIVQLDYLKGTDDTIKTLGLHGGLNFWLSKQTFNLKADVAYVKRDVGANGRTFKDLIGTLQGQVFF